MSKVLVVDDEEIVRYALTEKLKENGFSVSEAYDGRNAIEMFREKEFDAVLLDLRMPEMDGIETLNELKKHYEDVPVIIVTAYGDIPTAVEAIKIGAYDFIEKPPQISKLIVTLRRAIEKSELMRKVKRLDTAYENSLECLLGRSRAIRDVIEQIQKVAWSDFSIIIQGETGTGKSFIASAIHSLSKRVEKAFVKVDVGVIPETLIESELFGHEKGAFTGADRKKKGYFELSNGGTIFIDELQNIPLSIQSKLLTVVEEKRIYPIGSIRPVDINVRLITATNKNIKESVSKNEFREDLFFRLGEFIITIPPLRERLEDIPFFCRKFLLEAATEFNRQFREIDDDAMGSMLQYHWPGNVRELKNVIRKAALLADDGIIKRRHINFMADPLSDKKDDVLLFPLRDAVKNLEKNAITNALRISNGNKTKAVALLQIDYKTLLTKIKEYGLNA